MSRRISIFFSKVALSALAILFIPSLVAAQSSAWDSLKQLAHGDRIRVAQKDSKFFTGEFQSFTDEAIILHVKSADQTILRQNLQSVSIRRAGHRGRNALIGGAIGAGVGLGAGVAIDRCSPNEIVCTGNKGKAILTPVFGLLGALVGAVIPAGSWQQIYRAS